MNSQQIFFNLIGAWHFSRLIINILHTELSGSVEGIVEFSPDVEFIDRLHYTEEGRFKTESGLNLKIRKEFIYQHDSQNNTISIYSAHNRQALALLYTLSFGAIKVKRKLIAKAAHRCKLDLYEAEYKFIESEKLLKFSVRQKVTGPNKNYFAVTMLNKS